MCRSRSLSGSRSSLRRTGFNSLLLLLSPPALLTQTRWSLSDSSAGSVVFPLFSPQTKTSATFRLILTLKFETLAQFHGALWIRFPRILLTVPLCEFEFHPLTGREDFSGAAAHSDLDQTRGIIWRSLRGEVCL